MMSQGYQPDRIFLDQGLPHRDDPIFTFERWYRAAKDVSGFPAQAMSLATVSGNGDPDVRVVLLQAVAGGGLVFFTNLSSVKGEQMLATGKAAACFHWPAMGRQVRLRGEVHQVEDNYADSYFSQRPRGAQIGAHASPQSSVISDRAALIDRVRDAEIRFENGPVPRPVHWSGMRLVPSQIEFWEDGDDRLHDRLLFTRSCADADWVADRLAP